MIRFNYLSGSLKGTAASLDKKTLRVGVAGECDVRFDPERDPTVSNYHAAIVFRDGAYHLIDTSSRLGTIVNGNKVNHWTLSSGDLVRFGGTEGPEVKVEVVVNDGYDPDKEAREISGVLKTGQIDASAFHLADLAGQRIAEARAKAGGTRSRNTLAILASTLGEVSQAVGETTKKKWVRVVAVVGGVGAGVALVLGSVVYVQHREIAGLLATKAKLDHDISGIQEQMQSEQDSGRLDELEQKLSSLTTSARTALVQLSEKDQAKAKEAEDQGDEMDREIRRILAKFDASTYAVPPIFKQRLQYHVDLLVKANVATRSTYERKKKYWAIISKEFAALRLPEEMAYVAWQESKFDPQAKSSVGARGMWQMTKETARSLGLRVDGPTDERMDVPKQTRAAAKYLANLLAEFGEDSFMLAMASYNRGENGVRRVLHQVAQEPGGFKKEKRDFWHLYRLKKLPEETREYVPKILAAAIICSNPERYGLESSSQ